MDVNLFLGATTIAATGFGIWGLVFHRKNGNGKHPPEPAVAQLVEQNLWQVEKLAQVLQPLATLPNRMEQVFERLAEAQSKEPEAPEWSTHMLEHLEYIEEQITAEPAPPPAWPPEMVPLFERLTARLEEPPVPPAWPPGLAASLDRITDKLDALLQVPPVEPEHPLVELEPLIEQIKELVDVERKRAARQNSESGKANSGGEAPAVTQPSPTLAPPTPQSSKPITRAAGPVILEEFNTITLDEFTVYELRAPEHGIFAANILNLGPGWLYVRANAEPTIADPKATTLPPGAIDNEVRVGHRLYVLASADGSITVRLAH